MVKIIHEHLDNRLDLQEEASTELEQLLDGINLDLLVKNPRAELAAAAQGAMQLVQEFGEDAAREGVRFANVVKKRIEDEKEIPVEAGDDPKKNAGEL